MNWSKSRIITILLILGVIGAYSAYRYAYQPHETIEEMKIGFEDSADKFKTEVAGNAEKWQNVIVKLNGKITAKDEVGAMMNETVFCQFKDAETLANIAQDKAVTIKGRFIGYDDLLEEIKLDQCIIVDYRHE